jgi:hypothetical protein
MMKRVSAMVVVGLLVVGVLACTLHADILADDGTPSATHGVLCALSLTLLTLGGTFPLLGLGHRLSVVTHARRPAAPPIAFFHPPKHLA